MSDMRYRTGEVSRILGMTQEAIRYYEKQNIIRCVREGNNGYRIYTYREINMLLKVRTFRSLGFSLCEAADLVKDKSLQVIDANLAQREENILKEIQWNQMLLQHTQRIRKAMQDIPSMVNRCRLEQSPEVYHISYQKDRKVQRSKELDALIAQWTSKMPMVIPCSILPFEGMGENVIAEIGFCISKEDSVYFDLAQNAAVRCLPAQQSLYTVLKVPKEETGFYNLLRPALAYMKENGWALAGDIYGFPIVSQVVEEAEELPTDYYQAWLPVRKSCEK